MSELQIVVFSLNTELCGVDAAQVTQIIKYQPTEKIPKTPRFVEGMINLRGKVVPVINLNKRFEFGETEITKKTKILISEVGKHTVGFMVNDVQELARVSEENIEVLPQIISDAGNGYMRKVAKKGDTLITVVDLQTVLAENEIKKLK